MPHLTTLADSTTVRVLHSKDSKQAHHLNVIQSTLTGTKQSPVKFSVAEAARQQDSKTARQQDSKTTRQQDSKAILNLSG